MSREFIEKHNYRIIKSLGKGGFGEVYLARDRGRQEDVAIKAILSEKVTDSLVNTEIRAMLRCRSPFTVHFYNSFHDDKYYYIVMEYCPRGSLDVYLKNNKGFDEQSCRKYLAQVILGLEILHKNNLVHRDVKCQNIFVVDENIVKLGDFGIAGHLENDEDMLKTRTGSAGFMAPEVTFNIGYNYKADIFSLGCTAVQMAEGNPNDALQREGWSKDFLDFVRKCCTVEADDRPSLQELINHPFIKGMILFYRQQEFIGKWNKPANYVQEIAIGNNMCNYEYEFKLKDYHNLQSIRIGSSSFCIVTVFSIENCSNLKSVTIGDRSFMAEAATSGFFCIMNCSSLQSFKAGKFAFQKFNNINFSNLMRLQFIELEDGVFEGDQSVPSNRLVLEELPSLQSIVSLGTAFFFTNDLYVSSILYLIVFLSRCF